MNRKSKKRIPKVLPIGIAMGVLFSASPLASPLTEYKVKADVDTFGTIVTTFGKIYDAFLAEPFGKWLEEVDVKTTYTSRNENIAYKAPTFQKGEFGISAFDYYKNKDFSKKVKIAYPNGKVEYKTIKHGQQLRIKDAGTIVDLTPDEPSLSNHDILYITQKHLDEGNTGVSLTNFKTYYLKSDNSGRRNDLGWAFLKKQFPDAYHNGIRVWGVDEDELFKKLPEDKRILGTSTSNPVSKDELSSLTDVDIDEMKYRMSDILTQHKEGGYSSISLKLTYQGEILRSLEDGRISKSDGNAPLGSENFTITPIKKGSNKVLLRERFTYIPSELGAKADLNIGPDKVWTLVDQGFGAFILKNDKGQYLSVDGSSAQFTDETTFFSTNLGENKWNNWLIDWYPGKENERKKYDIKEIIIDEKDSTKWTAKDSRGDLIKNNWVKRGAELYYAGSNGVFLKEWQEIGGKKYYFNPQSFTLLTTNGSEINGKCYYFNDDGSVKQSTWTEDSNGLFYSDASGALIKEGLQKIDSKLYYFQNYSANRNELRLEDQNIILHFSDKGVLERITDLNGEALTSPKVETLDGKKYCFNPNGTVLSIGWNDDGGKYGKYYLNDKGERVGGLQEIEGTLYYFADKGQYFSYGTLWPNCTNRYHTDGKGVVKRNFKGKTGDYSSSGARYIETDDSGRIIADYWAK